MTTRRWWVLASAAALVVLALAAGGVLEQAAEQIGNPVATPPPYRVDAATQALHARLYVADMHADTLLAGRDPLQAVGHGQLDLPRMQQGGVRLQVFSIVTNMPLCPGFEHCAREPNLVALLAVAQGWPVRSWVSDTARALHQAEKLRDAVAASAGMLAWLRDRNDLLAWLAPPRPARPVGAVLAVEGAQAIGDDVAGVDALADAGVRVLGLAHYFDNAVAGSAHGLASGGITAFGRQVLQRAVARGMIIDLAHASPPAIDDFVDKFGDAPFIVSHEGLRSVCDNPRNLSDVQVRRIVRANGLIGVGAWSIVLCVPADAPASAYVERMVATIQRAVLLADREHTGRGYEYVGLGSDFDGWVRVGFDAGGWPLLTEGLLRAGLSNAEIARIMGGNVCRLLLRGLPGHGPPPPEELCDPR
jgi:microsomal dipeptidase-like Zn-dependent dipeptidase